MINLSASKQNKISFPGKAFTETRHWAILLWLIGMHLGAAAGFFIFSWKAFFVCLFLYWLTIGVGITLGFHRYFAHQSFTLLKPFVYIVAFIGCMAGQGGPIEWVAAHRYHHSHSDETEDPHSPVRGFFWAHMGWLFARKNYLLEPNLYRKYAPDMAADRVLLFLDRSHIFAVYLTGIVLYWLGGWSFVVWGIFVRLVLGYHATWLVNSATHIWGYRTFDTKDLSKNNACVAFLTFGEGWHNNHHAFIRSARHGLKWWEIDMTYWTLCLLKTLGLVRDIHTPADLTVLGPTKMGK